ncbi:MAG TPA: hypothetical protein VG736_01730 [Vicinamibacterales bacterium]|jgi:hypothetical protein|nr:hypothetical protein [Vicinamibacterales bacterium]
MPTLGTQVALLFVLALPIACVAWTVTHEEVFREPREYCVRRSKTCRHLLQRKFFYLFTCEYCFSHYVTALALFITRYQLIYADWRGYVLAGFALVWIANVYMSLFGRLRLDIREERLEIEMQEYENRAVTKPARAGWESEDKHNEK